MFCPKCGTQNPDNGRFCRTCGTDLGNVSEALSGNATNKNSGFGMIQPMQPMQPMQMRDRKGKPIHWESAITKIFTGIAFLVVSIALSFSRMGQSWWFWMLIPAFGSLGSGIAQIIQLRKMEKGNYVGSNVELPNATNFALPPKQSDFDEIEQLVNSGNKIEAIKVYRESTGSSLKDAKKAVEKIQRGELQYPKETTTLNNYEPPPRGSIYDTGELRVPPSVTEDTTRHLELNKEGETMTLPPTNKI